MKIRGKRIIALVLMLVICFAVVGKQNPSEVQAASKYITRANFIKLVVKELGVEVSSDTSKAYIEKAKEIGLITNKTFLIYSTRISKIDAAIILVRADEFANGNNESITDELINEIMKKRISDINKVSKVKRPYLAKAYALGYIKGNSNGEFSTDRTMNPNYKITLTYAKQLISFINNKEARHTIAPDGQLIRTTNLPEFAEYYPYILASYPNKYYDWEFFYMKMMCYDNGVKIPAYGTKYMKDLEKYASPIDILKYRENEAMYYSYKLPTGEKATFKDVYEFSADQWEESARKYLELVFNVNYKKTFKNDNWSEQLKKVSKETSLITGYIEKATENKTIVESSIIAVDKSSLYVYDNLVHIRAYVKYRVNSCISIERVCWSPIIYTFYMYPLFTDMKVGEWRECYLDLEMECGTEDGKVAMAIINDYFHDTRVVIK